MDRAQNRAAVLEHGVARGDKWRAVNPLGDQGPTVPREYAGEVAMAKQVENLGDRTGSIGRFHQDRLGAPAVGQSHPK